VPALLNKYIPSIGEFIEKGLKGAGPALPSKEGQILGSKKLGGVGYIFWFVRVILD
jgi:hypothetical protein